VDRVVTPADAGTLRDALEWAELLVTTDPFL
jgi:hypothetical protein